MKDHLSPLSHSCKIVQITDDAKKRAQNSLYVPCRAITNAEFGTKKLLGFVSDMRQVMHNEHGIGLAANQAGRSVQIFVIEYTRENDRYDGFGAVPYIVFINPKIVEASKTRKNFWHGCLSAKGVNRSNLATYEWIKYEAYDEHGNKKSGKLDGMASVIFQHELRHLLGGTYVDFGKVFYEPAQIDKKILSGEIEEFALCDESVPLLLSDYKIGDSLEQHYAKRIN